MPSWVDDMLAVSDKTNLAPARVLHFVALAILTTHLISRDQRWLRSFVRHPLMLCGRRSLEVFCAGIFLSFVAHFILELVSYSVAMQIAVSLGGIGIMTAVAWLRSW
jgi:hypothetical protein